MEVTFHKENIPQTFVEDRPLFSQRLIIRQTAVPLQLHRSIIFSVYCDRAAEFFLKVATDQPNIVQIR